jgi:hypothetical protein
MNYLANMSFTISSQRTQSMWNTVETLRSISHTLMWAAVTFAILAAMATGVRYYVDRRAGELSSMAQRAAASLQRQEQLEREAILKKQLEDARREQEAAAAKLATVEAMARGRHLTSEQCAKITASARMTAAALSKVDVTAANSNNEAQTYALDFVKSLRDGGCASDLALPIPGLTPDVTGIHIAVRDVQNIPPGANALAALLSASDVRFTISAMKADFFPGSSFILVIGAK